MAFEASARLGSFTLAAAELSITQGAVSRQIQALEDLLDITLFVRAGRHIELSQVGHQYAADIAPALARIRGASARALAFSGVGEQLHLAVLPTFAARWLMPKMADFYRLHPNVNLHLHSRTGEYSLQDSGLDAAINVGEAPFTGMVSHVLADEEMILVVSPHLQKERPLKTLPDVFRHRLLHVMARSEAWQELAIKHHVECAHTTQGPQFDTTLHLIEAAVNGIGVALIARCLVLEELQSGRLIELPIHSLETKRKYCFLYTPEREMQPGIVKLRDWLLSYDVGIGGR